MKIKSTKVITIIIILINLVLLKYLWNLIFTDPTPKATSLHSKNSFDLTLEEKVTIVFRSFEHFENDLAGTLEQLLSLIPSAHILIISDSFIYPPLSINNHNHSIKQIKFISLDFNLFKSNEQHNPFYYIQTKYVLFLPDSSRIPSKKIIEDLIKALEEEEDYILSVPFVNNQLTDCTNLQLNIREWTIQYDLFGGTLCDLVKGKQALIAATNLLKRLPDPFMKPSPEALYIQATSMGIKVKLNRELGPFFDGRQLFTEEHLAWKASQVDQQRQNEMWSKLGFKKVIRETGLVEWHGCARDTPRCFGSVINDMPDYLLAGKWTPPCCLAGLRITAKHVFSQLDLVGVRYWLEGGSLLGAMRAADILPWDYDIDIGIYQEDLEKCPWLRHAQREAIVDKDGFVWEKALEGEFFRVHFSRTNRLHVDIFPFYSKNGTMTKNTWFHTHRQDVAFPEHYLEPISTIDFIGRQVPAPNNIRDFLEFKFGKGVVENPQYPDPTKIKFSPKEHYKDPQIIFEN